MNVQKALGAPVRMLKRVTSSVIRFPTAAAGWASLLLPRTRINYAEEVNLGANSIIVACINWISRAFAEPPVRIQQPDQDGQLSPVPNHPLTQLMVNPNPFYSGSLLWSATISDFELTGNAYWIKIRSAAGRVVELWWVPSWLIWPIAEPDDGTVYISAYAYQPASGGMTKLDPNDVVHFRYGIDPYNTRIGRSPAQSLLREVFTDDEAANFSAALLRNVGIPGVIVSPDSDVPVPEDMAESIKLKFQDRFTGDNRGQALVMRGKTKVDIVSFTPEQMDLGMLRRVPEERISAVLGVPAIVVGLGAGLSRATYSNYNTARDAAYQSCMIPLWRLIAAELSRQLLPDFGNPADLVLDFDLSEVRALQEDEDARVVRLLQAFTVGAITRGELRAEIGKDTQPADDVYLIPVGLIAIPPGSDQQSPAIIAQPAPPPPKPIPGNLDDDAEPADPAAADAAPDDAPKRAQPHRLTGGRVKAMTASDYRSQLQATQTTQERQLTDQLEAAFTALGVAALTAIKPKLAAVVDGTLDPSVLLTLLPKGLAASYLAGPYGEMQRSAGAAIYKLVAAYLLTSLSFGGDDPNAPGYLASGAQRVGLVDLDGQTRDAVNAALTDGLANGDNQSGLETRVSQYVAGSHMYPGIAKASGANAARRYRAQTIAVTETAWALMQATLAATRSAGGDQVQALDNQTGFGDPECSDRDGQIFSVDDSGAFTEHPRGTLELIPYKQSVPHSPAIALSSNGHRKEALVR